jgi:hypothetical protein
VSAEAPLHANAKIPAPLDYGIQLLARDMHNLTRLRILGCSRVTSRSMSMHGLPCTVLTAAPPVRLDIYQTATTLVSAGALAQGCPQLVALDAQACWGITDSGVEDLCRGMCVCMIAVAGRPMLTATDCSRLCRMHVVNCIELVAMHAHQR